MVLNRRLKFIVYGASAGVGFVIAALVSYLAFGETLLYAIFFGAFGAGVVAVLSRVVLHLVSGDNAPRMWAVSFDLLASCAGWLVAVLATSIGVTSAGLALTVLGLVMAYGNRFVSLLADVLDTESSTPGSAVYTDIRYAFIDDDPSKGADSHRPLCLINGTPCTVAEAYALGKGAMAADAIEYIKMIQKKEET